MITDPSLRLLLDALLAATTFEDAVEEVLSRLPAAGGLPSLRASVYRRLGPAADIASRGAPMLSGTCWREVREQRMPVLLSLEDGVVWLGQGGGPRAIGQKADSRSRELLRQLDLAAISALPLRRGGVVLGMLLLAQESVDPRAWRASLPALSLFADIAAPVLLGLPRRVAVAPFADPLMPVVGETMAAVLEDLGRYALENETVLLTGPTGVGKSRLAQWCHAHSHRRDRPFVVANLASVPPELIAGHLFGWRRGAFTGADTAHVGWVAEARGGTLFLDEIGKLDLPVQAQLLRVLDDGVFRPLGAARDEESDVRFIVGTNLDLERAAREGRFHEDLLYRIDVLPVALPPLDERRDEIPGWARLFASEGAVAVDVEADALAALTAASWPGNLRQLHSIVRRAAALSGGRPIGLAHVRRALRAPAGGTGGDLPDQMGRAARRFLDCLEGGTITFDDTNVFESLVMEEAVRRHGEREGLTRLGKGHSFEGGNHRKLLNRAGERVKSFKARLAGEPE